MSKNREGVGFDSYVLVGHEDSRVSFKYQNLLQDYYQLQKETKAARSKLEAMKLKKLTLQADVRFLRRRHKFLLKNKSSNPKKPAIIDRGFVEEAQHRKSTNDKIYLRKEAALGNIDHKGKAYAEKKNTVLSIPSHMLHGVMEQSHRRGTQACDLNQTVKINSFDVVGLDKDANVKTRVPAFDLNQKLREEEEEEELQEGYEPDNFVRSVNNDKLNELKLSMCRNVVRDASTSQGKKRNISRQDPVALRV